MDVSTIDLKSIVVYCRVATRDQVSLETQRYQITEQASRRGDTISRRFEDAPARGDRTDRPGLHQLREAVAAGKVSRLYVSSLDRLARCPKTLTLLLGELMDAGVSVITDNGEVTESAHIALSVVESATRKRHEHRRR